MLTTKINKYFKKTNKIRKYNTLVEALRTTFFFKKIFGTAVFEYKSVHGIIKSKFSILGFIGFLCWHSLFFYCAYVAYSKDQSILRLLYNTKLKQYGDDYERAATIIFVLYSMWKASFNLNMHAEYVQYSCDIDKLIAGLGVIVDHRKNATLAIFILASQILVLLARGLSIWATIGNLDMVVPYERVFQVIYSDVAALMLAGYYCYCVTILRERYVSINQILDDIKAQKCWEYAMFFSKHTKTDKTFALQEQYICKKIKMCAKIHCMLYKTTLSMSEIFGIALMVSMFFGFNSIVLYMFYFMEATASSLVYDLRRYVCFLIYVFWQTAYAAGVIYVIVYFSESTVKVATHASCITHEIINSDLSPSITKEAMQLSMQLLHQMPIFSACGIKIDYAFLREGGRSIVTYLVILLQFVMDS